MRNAADIDASPRTPHMRRVGVAVRFGIALLVPAAAVVLHELGHYLVHVAFGYPVVSLSYSDVSTGPAPAGVDTRLADGLAFAAGTTVSLTLVLVALVRRVPLALGAALVSFELLRAAIGTAIGVSNKGVRALWGGVGELRYLATAFDGWPPIAGGLLGLIELGTPIVAAVLLWRRVPHGERAGLVIPALVGTAAGLALWLQVVGPLVLP